MIFFKSKKNEVPKFQLDESLRVWVEDNFKWLIQVFGYPSKPFEHYLISEKYFPNTFSSNDLKIENLIIDLSVLLNIESNKIKFEIHKDLRDAIGVPLEIAGKSFETETEIKEDIYIIHIANTIYKRPNRLIFSLIYEFVKIRLIENKLNFDNGEDTSLFIYLASIYLGFGIPLSQNLIEIGRSEEGNWETKWNYVSEMPPSLMAFSLAFYSKLIDQENPEWKAKLPQQLSLQFDSAIIFLNESPSSLFDKNELEANHYFFNSNQEYQQKNLDAAISKLQKVVQLTNNSYLKADAYNNIGYYQLRKGLINEGIPNFKEAIKLDPNYGFAHDNLAYSLILSKQIEKGKEHLLKASQTDNNDIAYNYRNWAMYYNAIGEISKAKDHFELAFKSAKESVDLLELDYANFLIEQDNLKEGMIYLEKAVEKGEPEAIEMKRRLNKN